MNERWCKLYEHAADDPKLVGVAALAGVKRSLVSATWVKLLAHGAAHEGSIAEFNIELWAAWCEEPAEAIRAVIACLRKVAMLAGETIAKWVQRQGAVAVAAAHATAAKIERAVSTAASSAARMRRKRERDRETVRQGDLFGASHPGVTPSHLPVTCDATAAPPPAPPPREYIKKNTPPGPPPRAGAPRAMGLQIAEWEGQAARQAEILLPLEGGPPRRLTARERRHEEWLAAAKRGVMRAYGLAA